VAMARFGDRNIRAGEPINLLQERFAALYFMHRFALNALSKTIGGMEYSNAVRGDGQQATRPIPYQEQSNALRDMLAALRPEELAIPDTVLSLMSPNATAVTPFVELFGSRTRPAFDELGAAQILQNALIERRHRRQEHRDPISARVADPVTDDHAGGRRAARRVMGASVTRQPATGGIKGFTPYRRRRAVAVVQRESFTWPSFVPMHDRIALQCR